MKCGKNTMNSVIIIVLISIIFVLYYMKLNKKETFHGPYDRNRENQANIGQKNTVLNTQVDDIFAYIKSFFIF